MAEQFIQSITARFTDDLATISDVLLDGTFKAWELDDAIIIEQTIDLLGENVDHRIDMAVESAAWQGTQAGRVDAIDAKGYLFGWELDEGANHCDDCIALAAGGPYTIDELARIGIPGDARTKCNGGCRCKIVPVM